MNNVHRKTTRHALNIALCAMSLFAGGAAWAVPAALPAPSEAAIMKDLGLLENRFFSRQYANDPTEKRLERLELLVFGATQDGDVTQRWSRLNKAIASRASAPAKSAPAAAAPAEKPPETSSQYPVLNTLEWRALKQTFPKESMDQRLGRLEKKLFGQDAPGMAYVDRVERLKRTLGIGITAALPSGPTGPAPRARPRGSAEGMPFQFGDGAQIFGDEGLGGNSPFSFGFGNSPFGNSPINGAFAQLFADMNKQMAELDRLGPGSWTLDPKTGMWVDQFTGKQVKPDGAFTAPKRPLQPLPQLAPKPLPQRQIVPFNFGNDNDSKLPPYTDPNSI